LHEAAGGAVVAVGDLVGFLRGFGAAVAVNLEGDNDPANLLGGAFDLEPMLRSERGRRVVIVHLDVDLDGAGFSFGRG